MKQEISALMDGELCDEEADILLKKIRLDESASQDWRAFHLIGDVMRQPHNLPQDLGSAFFERLAAEPTILAPQPKLHTRLQYFAMSAVASIMAMAFLAWFAMHIDNSRPDPSMQQVAQQSGNSISVASVADSEGMDDYLLAHHEYSPSTELRGAASYIHTVAVRH